MKKEKIIFFDFDGVIADSFDIAFEINQMMRPTLTREKYQQVWDRNLADVEYIEEIAREVDFEKEYSKKYRDLSLCENIKASIEDLTKNYHLCIISSGENYIIEEYLGRHGISEHFSEVLGFGVEKSKVKKFNMVLEKYGVHPKDAIFITDTSGDIREAKEASIGHIIGITGGFQTRESLERAAPDRIVERFDEILNVAEEYFGK